MEREEEEEKVMREEMMPFPLPRRNPKIRVKENIQLVPPRTDWVQQEASKDQGKIQGEGKVQDEGWTKVTRREKKREKRKKEGEGLSQPAVGPPLPPSQGQDKDKEGKVSRVYERGSLGEESPRLRL